MHYDKVCIEGLAYELPPQVLTTRAMESALGGLYGRLGIQPGWLEAVTGIKQRRMWATGDNAELAAARAAERAVAEGDVSKNEIDVLVSTSVYKAHLEPSVACKVHHALGLRPTALNFDVGNACLGFLSGMQVVANMIELGQARAGLVVAGECSREVTRSTLNALQDPSADMVTYKDNLATMTLGSGAAAMLLVHKDLSTTGHRLVGGHVQSATQHAGLCYGGLDGMKTDPTRLLAEGVSLARRTYDVFRNGGGAGGPHARRLRAAPGRQGQPRQRLPGAGAGREPSAAHLPGHRQRRRRERRDRREDVGGAGSLLPRRHHGADGHRQRPERRDAAGRLVDGASP